MRTLLALLATAPIALADPVIDRGAYRIELGAEPRVVFENGETIAIAWVNDRIVAVEGVRAERHGLPPLDDAFAAAILLARDLGARVNDKPPIRAIPIDTVPPLVLLEYNGQWYVERIGLVDSAWPEANVHRCLLSPRCHLHVRGPDGAGMAVFEGQRLVERPQTRHQPRRAWKELVPGCVVRMRAALIEAATAIAANDREAARFPLRDALDAVDDIVTAMPMSAPRAIDYEILRDDTRIAIGQLDTIGSDAIDALRLALVDIQRSPTVPARAKPT